jgi:hypothetical protein
MKVFVVVEVVAIILGVGAHDEGTRRILVRR